MHQVNILTVLVAEPKDSVYFQRFVLLFICIWKGIFKISDNAVNVLLTFLKFLTSILINSSGTKGPLSSVNIPSTLSSAKTSLGIKDNFHSYVVCPKCHSLYNMEDCLKSRKCRHVEFPKHPQKAFRQHCDENLLKEIKLTSGAKKLVAIKTYCYRSIQEELSERLAKPGFMALINSWRNYSSVEGMFTDICDGRAWKELQSTEDNMIGFMLNVDWFNPYKHGCYSMGAIYLTILNLPRQLRFKEHNTILVCLIPGPKEPKLVINSYLTPLVQELLLLDKGIWFSCPDVIGNRVLMKGRLIAVSCDIPASRKVCGFVGHSALKACNKCLNNFERNGDRTDYSGFDVDRWLFRTNDEHRSHAEQYLQCKTKAERKTIERDHGVRFSVLLDLPYFDAIVHCAIDPMHNLFLGTSKHMIEVWQKANIITKKVF